MPRPVKCRKVCHFPNVLEFLPADGTEKNTPIVLTVDEYETIRLLDKKGYTQEQCAASMQIARTTVQRIYEIARKKIADALIDGHPLKIEGGDFRICDGQDSDCCFFFKIVQNKLHYAAHGHTAAEVIYQRADAEKPIMGLTSFSGELPALKDIGIAKNYLEENELKVLNNLVSGYFDLAEINAIEHKPMYMDDYVKQLDSVLSSGNRKLLTGSGSVSHKQALEKAKSEYRKYQEITLTPVEKAYLESIKEVSREVKRR